jgi:hypothetical protein
MLLSFTPAYLVAVDNQAARCVHAGESVMALVLSQSYRARLLPVDGLGPRLIRTSSHAGTVVLLSRMSVNPPGSHATEQPI